MIDSIRTQLIRAVDYALNDQWHQAHHCVQNLNHPTANWLHAVLHKIEGDSDNSRYWYARSAGRQYSDFDDPQQELTSLLQSLEQGDH